MAERIRQGIVWVGIPLVLAATTLPYSDGLTDYMIAKTAAIYAGGGLMLCLLLAVWILDRRFVWAPFPVHLPMVAFGCVSFLCMILAQNKALSLEILAAQVSLLIFCLVVANSVRGVGEIAGILWIVSLVGHAVAFLGLLQYFGIHLIPLPAAYGDHPVSTLGNPNFVAHYLCMVLPVVAVLLLHSRSTWAKVWLSSTILFASFHLLITRSRAGWAVAALTLLFILIATRRDIRILPILARGALVMALLAPGLWLGSREITLSSGDRLSQRFEYIARDAWQRAQSAFDRGDFSIAMRRIIWADSVDLIRSRPLLGTGPGNFELHLPSHRSVARHREWSELMGDRQHIAYRAHNEYLEQAAETGIVGLIMSIQSGDNPRIVEHKLSVYIQPKYRPSGEKPMPKVSPISAEDQTHPREEIVKFTAEKQDLFLRLVREQAHAAEAEQKAKMEEAATKVERGEMSLVALLAQLSGRMRSELLHMIKHPSPPPITQAPSQGFSFEDIVKLKDREIQILLREVDQKDLVVALSGATDELREKVFGNMSRRVRTFIQEEMSYEHFQPEDVLEMQARIVAQVFQLKDIFE